MIDLGDLSRRQGFARRRSGMSPRSLRIAGHGTDSDLRPTRPSPRRMNERVIRHPPHRTDPVMTAGAARFARSSLRVVPSPSSAWRRGLPYRDDPRAIGFRFPDRPQREDPPFGDLRGGGDPKQQNAQFIQPVERGQHDQHRDHVGRGDNSRHHPAHQQRVLSRCLASQAWARRGPSHPSRSTTRGI